MTITLRNSYFSKIDLCIRKLKNYTKSGTKVHRVTRAERKAIEKEYGQPYEKYITSLPHIV